MNIVTKVEYLFGRRWLLITLGVAIGLASAFLLRLKLEGIYFEYWVFPRDKAADGYIYPQLRYTLFDAVLLLWCIDGLIFSIMSVRSVVESRSIILILTKRGFRSRNIRAQAVVLVPNSAINLPLKEADSIKIAAA
jgi:hypothetical protein